MRFRQYMPAVAGALLTFAPAAHATPPNFDHDPMSISFDGQAGMAKKHHHHYHDLRDNRLRLFDVLPPNTTPIGVPLTAHVETGSDAVTAKRIRIRLFDTFQGKSFKQELPSADYTLNSPNPAPVTDGIATFSITFHTAALDGGDYNKIYIVASVNQGNLELGGFCFQTVTVYQEQSTLKGVRRPHRRVLHPRHAKEAL